MTIIIVVWNTPHMLLQCGNNSDTGDHLCTATAPIATAAMKSLAADIIN